MKPVRRPASVLATAGLLAGLHPAALAQGVTLAGRMGDRALLVIDGQTQLLGAGQSARGVRLLRWSADAALVERDGATYSLRLGATPAQVGGAAVPAGGREIVIAVGPGGHFVTAGAINGRSVRFMVDTGATVMALGRDEAQRLGIDLQRAASGVSETANGPVAVQRVTLDRVRIGEVELPNIEAMVVPAAMPYVLLGNSFLMRFQMRRESDVMRLELR